MQSIISLFQRVLLALIFVAVVRSAALIEAENQAFLLHEGDDLSDGRLTPSPSSEPCSALCQPLLAPLTGGNQDAFCSTVLREPESWLDCLGCLEQSKSATYENTLNSIHEKCAKTIASTIGFIKRDEPVAPWGAAVNETNFAATTPSGALSARLIADTYYLCIVPIAFMVLTLW